MQGMSYRYETVIAGDMPDQFQVKSSLREKLRISPVDERFPFPGKAH